MPRKKRTCTVNKYTRTMKKLTHQLGREPDTEEIAVKMKISADKVRAVSQVVRDVYSLETPISDQEGDTLKDVLSDDNEPSPLNS